MSQEGGAPRASRRWVRALRLAAGSALLITGGALLVLPGPGIPLVLAGLALLARDLPWARRLQATVRERWERRRRRRISPHSAAVTLENHMSWAPL